MFRRGQTTLSSLFKGSSWLRQQAAGSTAGKGSGFRAHKPRGPTPLSSTGEAHSKIKKIKHWQMWSMVGFCGIAGFLAGKFVPIDEDDLVRPQFDLDGIKDQMKMTFEFRPDLAPTALRAAFLLAARRAHVDFPFIGQSCAVEGGLGDVANVLQFQTIANTISTEDLTALAAIEAIRFMRGPADKVAFHWGRQDHLDQTLADEEEDEDLVAKKAAGDDGKKGGKATVTYNVKKGRSIEPGDEPAIAPKLTMHEVLSSLHKDLTDAEMVALMACHGLGEYHVEVSGIDDFPSRCAYNRASRFTLDNHYFKILLDLDKQWAPWDPPRTMNNRSKALPKMMRAYMTTETEKDGKMKQKKKLIVATEREVRELLQLSPEWRQYTELFAKDKAQWEDAFAAGFSKLLEGNFSNTLRKYTPRSEYAAELKAVREEKRMKAEMEQLGGVSSEGEAPAGASGVKKAPLKLK